MITKKKLEIISKIKHSINLDLTDFVNHNLRNKRNGIDLHWDMMSSEQKNQLTRFVGSYNGRYTLEKNGYNIMLLRWWD